MDGIAAVIAHAPTGTDGRPLHGGSGPLRGHPLWDGRDGAILLGIPRPVPHKVRPTRPERLQQK